MPFTAIFLCNKAAIMIIGGSATLRLNTVSKVILFQCLCVYMCGFSDYCNSGCCFTTELHNCSLHNCCQRHFLSTVEPVIYIFYYVTTPVLAVQGNMK